MWNLQHTCKTEERTRRLTTELDGWQLTRKVELKLGRLKSEAKPQAFILNSTVRGIDGEVLGKMIF